MSNFGFALLSQQIAEFIAAEIDLQKEDALGDSAIERLFFAALRWRCEINACRINCFLIAETLTEEQQLKKQVWARGELPLLVCPQAAIARRRVDFLIYALNPQMQWRALIVECDGHSFHERTKEQAATDRSKDRAVVMAGVDCFRFTGSELWRDPWGCAKQVTDWAEKEHL